MMGKWRIVFISILGVYILGLILFFQSQSQSQSQSQEQSQEHTRKRERDAPVPKSKSAAVRRVRVTIPTSLRINTTRIEKNVPLLISHGASREGEGNIGHEAREGNIGHEAREGNIQGNEAREGKIGHEEQLAQSLTPPTPSASTTTKPTRTTLEKTTKIEYGVPLGFNQQRTPLVMIRSSLSKALHDRFLEEPMFSCSESELELISGLDKRIKPPIYIYEGYFHSLPRNSTIYSKNPNPLIGTDFYKPAAPPFLRAFYYAFRRANKGLLDSLKESLRNSSSGSGSDGSPVSGSDVRSHFADWIEADALFGDLSVQIHYGGGNTPAFQRAWHSDAENSLLHFAITLRGNRVLHSRRRSTPRGDVQEVMEPQAPGDVYLSSSTLMMHAPKFSNSTYKERVIAIHARVLYTTKEINGFRKDRTNEGWMRLTEIIAGKLKEVGMQVPTLAEVEESLVYIE